jgi:hypothetical protein
MKRALRAAWLLPPIAVFLAFYWRGLFIWFAQDDFAWLNLSLRFTEGYSLWRLALEPAAQGTIRPLSERLFFIGFHQWFGLDALPYRALIYLTQAGNLLLVALIARRLIGSTLAAAAAAIFWTLNVGVAASLSWTSTYNQILCSLFILTAFLLFLRYTETGERRYYAAQWLAFLAGFGALELNAAYPALAGLYALVRARRYLASTLPMFAVSAAYTILHRAVAPKPASGPYSFHWEWDIFATLIEYVKWMFGGVRFQQLYAPDRVEWLGWIATGIVGLALAGFLLLRLAQRDWRPIFFAGWFLIFLGPVLPLRDHFSGYYLTLPAIGPALLGGWAFASAWQARRGRRGAAVVVAGLYLGVSAAVAQVTLSWQLARTEQARRLVLGIGRAQALHQGKVILLEGVSNEIFWGCVKDRPFPLVGAAHVYLAPGATRAIEPHPELAELSEYELPARPAARLLRAGEAIVYDVSGRRPRNITRLFRASLGPPERLPPARWIDAGKPWFADQIGAGWQPIERGYRWMGRQAELRLGGPQKPGEVLYIAGFCPARQLVEGPLEFRVGIESGEPYRVRLTRPDAGFEFRFPLAPELIGKESVLVSLEVERTFPPPGENRQLGLAFGIFAIR